MAEKTKEQEIKQKYRNTMLIRFKDRFNGHR
jgi:hypothetical protein